MAVTRKPLSLDPEQLQAEYDVLIIGSGTGGSIAAARIAEANAKDKLGLRIALIERGKEWMPGEFPETEAQLAGCVRNGNSSQVKNPLGLFEFHDKGDLQVLRACGLGGSSLVDMGVSKMPDIRVFEQEGWPDEIRKDIEYGRFMRGFKKAEEVLDKQDRPFGLQLERYNQVAKGAGLLSTDDERVGEGQIDHQYLMNFGAPMTNEQGVEINTCNLCGSCMSGCNEGARNGVAETYLTMAHSQGVEIYSRTEARFLERDEYGRTVAYVYKHDGNDLDWSSGPMLFPITARVVIVAAGTVGSSELLLRTRTISKRSDDGSAALFSMSSLIGKRVGRNGNMFVSVYNCRKPCDSVALGAADCAKAKYKVGPASTSAIDSAGSLAPLRDSVNFYDIAFPAPLMGTLKAGFKSLDLQSTASGLGAMFGGFKRKLFEGSGHNRNAALNHSLAFLILGHDDHDGRIGLDKDGSVGFRWPQGAENEVFKTARAKGELIAKNLEGAYVVEPEWDYQLGTKPMVLQPIGGCVMANNRVGGVVDHSGRVFDANDEDNAEAILLGLYVMGSPTIPTALAAPPTLTVAGLTERMVGKLIPLLKDGSLGVGPSAR